MTTASTKEDLEEMWSSTGRPAPSAETPRRMKMEPMWRPVEGGEGRRERQGGDAMHGSTRRAVRAAAAADLLICRLAPLRHPHRRLGSAKHLPPTKVVALECDCVAQLIFGCLHAAQLGGQLGCTGDGVGTGSGGLAIARGGTYKSTAQPASTTQPARRQQQPAGSARARLRLEVLQTWQQALWPPAGPE